MEPASERLAELAVALHQRGLRGAACRFAARNESYTLGSNIAYVKAAVVTTIENTLADGIWRERLTTELCGTMGNWLTYRASLHSVNVNNRERAYELAGKNFHPIQRAASLIVGAQRDLIKAKDTTRASQWLQEARSLIGKLNQTKT
jgi:hypothetical protein